MKTISKLQAPQKALLIASLIIPILIITMINMHGIVNL
jgi:hypothetical protein